MAMPRLILHPDSYCAAVNRIEASVTRAGGTRLALEYALAGNTGAIRLPAPGRTVRGEELWKSTCFELFIRAEESSAYYEFNFTPACEWAAYVFSAYRAGMHDLEMSEDPSIETKTTPNAFTIKVGLDLSAFLSSREAPLRLGLSAVVEEKNGSKSYWALRHPPGRPDFHHPDCFALELGASERA